MKRRQPKEFSFLMARRVRGGYTDASGYFIPDSLAHKWMSQEKRRTHKRERREGKQQTGE